MTSHAELVRRAKLGALAMWGTKTTSERFWEKVRKGDGCWEWTAGLDAYGYGQISVPTEKGKRPIRAHRFAWIEANGPTSLCVLHRCDNRKCVRLDHLFLGTRKDNAADRDRKGRTFNGNATRTHCIRGHEFNDENTRLYRGHRSCRACMRVRAKRYRPADLLEMAS